MDKPVMTVDVSNRYGLAAATITEYFGAADRGFPITEPTRTATAKDREGLTLAHISKFYGTTTGHPVNDPLHTVTTSPGHLGEVRTYLAKWDGVQPLRRWPEIRKLLNTYCGYNIPEDHVLILSLGSSDWFISDIGLRMLTPRELYAANGFPPDYIIDRDYTGREYSKTLQTARCGNAVPPPFAEALVRANLPELCGGKLETMGEFRERAAI
jgi:DNA (cytosine-5)-methyltransferase 1